MQISEKEFSAVCFLVLMDHHEHGFVGAAPGYVTEKLALLDRGYEAYASLDRNNQKRVQRYCTRWNCELPEVIKQYESRLYELT